jgi:hypothetical protein
MCNSLFSNRSFAILQLAADIRNDKLGARPLSTGAALAPAGVTTVHRRTQTQMA